MSRNAYRLIASLASLAAMSALAWGQVRSQETAGDPARRAPEVTGPTPYGQAGAVGGGTLLNNQVPAGGPNNLFTGQATPGLVNAGSTETRLYDPAAPQPPNVAAGGGVKSLIADPFGTALIALYQRSSDSLLVVGGSKPIVSLVPPEDTIYAQKMEAGEKSFKEGDYSVAFTHFETANLISHDTESLLAMTHALFSNGYYTSAASDLRKSIRLMPLLPAVSLKPKGFYYDPSDYVDKLHLLEKHLKDDPTDADGYLLMAYFAWFDTDQSDHVARARLALRRALAAEDDPRAVEVIETFWDGMQAVSRDRQVLKPLPGEAVTNDHSPGR